jgi:hypothetical protein
MVAGAAQTRLPAVGWNWDAAAAASVEVAAPAAYVAHQVDATLVTDLLALSVPVHWPGRRTALGCGIRRLGSPGWTGWSSQHGRSEQAVIYGLAFVHWVSPGDGYWVCLKVNVLTNHYARALLLSCNGL